MYNSLKEVPGFGGDDEEAWITLFEGFAFTGLDAYAEIPVAADADTSISTDVGIVDTSTLTAGQPDSDSDSQEENVDPARQSAGNTSDVSSLVRITNWFGSPPTRGSECSAFPPAKIFKKS